MGTDIYAFLQQNRDGEWEDFCELDIGRNYTLFALLADVRNDSDITPLDLCKGLPEGKYFKYAIEYRQWGEDAHNAHHCTLDKILLHDLEKNMSKELADEIRCCDLFNFPFNKDKLADIRMIFWFVN